MQRGLAVALSLTATISGCSFRGVSSMPLPGGVDTGPGAYEVKIVFENVLDLVQQSQCRVNDVPVGRVTKIALSDWHAVVTCKLRRSVELPANAVATVSQTSLLGEKFVALSAPQGQQPRGRLTQGAQIPLSRTTRTTEVEEVLSAVSMLVTGGGLEQIATINHELTAAMQGRTTQIRDLLEQINTFVGTLDRQKGQIVATIEKVDRLAATLARNNKTITDTIDSTAPAVKILNDQKEDLTKLLVNMDKLGTVATRIIRRSKDDTVANLTALQTILRNTNKASSVIPKILGGLFTFPFPSTVGQALKGDYANLFVTLDLNVGNIAHNLLAGTPLAGAAKVGQKIQNALPPPRTSVPDNPLGVLPDDRSTPNSGGTPGRDGGGILPPLGQGRNGAADGDLGALLSGGTT